MKDLRIGYLYSLAPIHSGSAGDLGNILDIAREVHTNFPYLPGSSLRGSLRNEVASINPEIANLLFGKQLDEQGQMGVHQVWFGDARLLWIPMRTMSLQGNSDIFTWVSCHSLIRDHAILTQSPFVTFPSHPVGTRAGTYHVADARIEVSALSDDQKAALQFQGEFPDTLKDTVKPAWSSNHIVLADTDFQVLMEHALWTQIRNKIDDNTGSAEVFWTDICIPRDTILYFSWGYNPLSPNPITTTANQDLIEVLTGLIQIGGQANVGRGWVQAWVNNPSLPGKVQPATIEVGV